MTNLDLIGGASKVPLPEGFFIIHEDAIVQKGDRICHVSATHSVPAEISWLNPDNTEIGHRAGMVGNLIIRKMA